MEKKIINNIIKNTNEYINENINILYEDNHILIVIKPNNLLSQGDITKDKNLLDILKEYIRVKEEKKGEVFLGLVHRLDRPTGGIMVFAKTSKAASRISKEIREKRFIKKYIVITDGIVEGKINKNNIIEKNIIKDEEKNISKISKDGKKSKMEYKILGRNEKENETLLEVNLLTGRSHQIRVFLSDINAPVKGDVKYAKHFKYGKKTDMLALFAYEISFKHPTKDEILISKYPPFNQTKSFNNFKDEILELIYN